MRGVEAVWGKFEVNQKTASVPHAFTHRINGLARQSQEPSSSGERKPWGLGGGRSGRVSWAGASRSRCCPVGTRHLHLAASLSSCTAHHRPPFVSRLSYIPSRGGCGRLHEAPHPLFGHFLPLPLAEAYSRTCLCRQTSQPSGHLMREESETGAPPHALVTSPPSSCLLPAVSR